MSSLLLFKAWFQLSKIRGRHVRNWWSIQGYVLCWELYDWEKWKPMLKGKMRRLRREQKLLNRRSKMVKIMGMRSKNRFKIYKNFKSVFWTYNRKNEFSLTKFKFKNLKSRILMIAWNKNKINKREQMKISTPSISPLWRHLVKMIWRRIDRLQKRARREKRCHP